MSGSQPKLGAHHSNFHMKRSMIPCTTQWGGAEPACPYSAQTSRIYPPTNQNFCIRPWHQSNNTWYIHYKSRIIFTMLYWDSDKPFDVNWDTNVTVTDNSLAVQLETKIWWNILKLVNYKPYSCFRIFIPESSVFFSKRFLQSINQMKIKN